ncbi:glycosyltransferase [Candidatus Daviesbacteria bacterium]|nr:glycosyltransferase [Candidatus Daviesbacteria bacterium]
MRVALIHDYLKEYGGAERVLEALHEIWPKAPVYVAYFDPNSLGPHADRIKKWQIKTSWFQKFPFASQLLSPFRLFAPLMFESFDLSEYDLVISSCSIYFSKAVIVKPEALHISYIHTPPRYLYGYTTSFNYKKNLVTRILGELANHILRIYDFEASQRPDILVANSKEVQGRIKKFYRRDSIVIYPPVSLPVIPSGARNLKIKSRDPSLITQDDKRTKGYFLSVGRLVRGKGIDVIVEACSRLGLPLKIVGTGPEKKNLESRIKNLGSKNIEFLGQVEDSELPKLYAGAKATIVASEDEDFGIVPVESMACGTPVIAPKAGGFLETVIDGPPSHKASAGQGKTGIFYGGLGQVSVESLIEVLKNFDPEKFNPEDCRKQAEKFSKKLFKEEILQLVEKNLT